MSIEIARWQCEVGKAGDANMNGPPVLLTQRLYKYE